MVLQTDRYVAVFNDKGFNCCLSIRNTQQGEESVALPGSKCYHGNQKLFLSALIGLKVISRV